MFAAIAVVSVGLPCDVVTSARSLSFTPIVCNPKGLYAILRLALGYQKGLVRLMRATRFKLAAISTLGGVPLLERTHDHHEV